MTFGCNNGKWNWYNSGKPVETMPIQVNEYGNKVIPTPVVEEAYKEYSAQFGTNQSLARLNERGGFGWSEMAILLFERIKRLEAERQNKD